tara:strand:+ start:509 stop:931 length:423 start_codon:yes stop_codon:yes gene_type:complete
MLKNIDPVLTGALLKALDEMGHGDTIALVDRNYPSFSAGPQVVHLGEIGVVRAAEAIFSVLPLDSFIDNPLLRMEADDQSPATPTHEKVLETARGNHSRPLEFTLVPRQDFYVAATHCSLIVQCLETAPYSCFIGHKGVV